MSFFDRFLTSEQKDVPASWNTLTSEYEFDKLIEESKSRPVAIFKHSTRCGTSFNIKYNLEENWDFHPEDLSFYYLDLIAYRSVSNLIAERLGVIHQSPQVIILKNGEATFATSHHMISVKAIRKNL